jgi:hypothetical protein
MLGSRMRHGISIACHLGARRARGKAEDSMVELHEMEVSALFCGSTCWKYPEFELTSKSLVNLSSGNVVKNHPWAHLQHIKVAKALYV